MFSPRSNALCLIAEPKVVQRLKTVVDHSCCNRSECLGSVHHFKSCATQVLNVINQIENHTQSRGPSKARELVQEATSTCANVVYILMLYFDIQDRSLRSVQQFGSAAELDPRSKAFDCSLAVEKELNQFGRWVTDTLQASGSLLPLRTKRKTEARKHPEALHEIVVGAGAMRATEPMEDASRRLEDELDALPPFRPICAQHHPTNAPPRLFHTPFAFGNEFGTPSPPFSAEPSSFAPSPSRVDDAVPMEPPRDAHRADIPRCPSVPRPTTPGAEANSDSDSDSDAGRPLKPRPPRHRYGIQRRRYSRSESDLQSPPARKRRSTASLRSAKSRVSGVSENSYVDSPETQSPRTPSVNYHTQAQPATSSSPQGYFWHPYPYPPTPTQPYAQVPLSPPHVLQNFLPSPYGNPAYNATQFGQEIARSTSTLCSTILDNTTAGMNNGSGSVQGNTFTNIGNDHSQTIIMRSPKGETRRKRGTPTERKCGL